MIPFLPQVINELDFDKEVYYIYIIIMLKKFMMVNIYSG
jgi:hypothetical protein